MYGSIHTLDDEGRKNMSTARHTVEVKRITLRAGNISTNGGEEREKEQEEQEKKTDSQ